jgi:hypothetical protein
MIRQWLQFSPKNPNPYAFAVQEGAERYCPTDDTVEHLGELLYTSLTNPKFIEWLLAESGVDVKKQFLRSHAFPGRITTAVGDFGEVLSGGMLEAFENLVVPVRKLRFRETATGPMRLTDVLALRIGDQAGSPYVEAMCFCSAKTATTPPDEDVAVGGYSQLEQDHEKEMPEILSFAMQALWLEDNVAMAALLSDVLARRDTPTPRLYRLSLVMDANVWNESFLERLDDENPSLPEFAAYVVPIGSLRELIDRSYDAARKVSK